MSELNGYLKEGYTIELAYGEFKSSSVLRRTELAKSSAFIKSDCPAYEAEVLKQAEEFMAGRMVLCGTMGQPYFVGNPPAWKDSPLGDNEFVWQLNRMEHWITLVRAYYLTGDARYGRKVLAELEDWINTCEPLPVTTEYHTARERFSSVHPWRSLEVGIRCHTSWNLALEALADMEEFTCGLFEKVARCLYQHGHILYTVCPVIWPQADHNHYLTECLGLLAVSGMMPFLKDSNLWRVHAAAELERCAGKQVTGCGGQIEGCPSYHNECLSWLTHSLDLAGRYEISLPEAYKDRIRSMFRYSIYAARPDGCNVPWGDSDALPQVYQSAFFMYEAFGDEEPLRICAVYFGRELLMREFYKQLWNLESPEALLMRMESSSWSSDVQQLPLVNWCKELSQVMIRTGWEHDGASVFFACRTPVHNDHAHIDPNGFDYYNAGIPILVDPGRYNYQEGPDRKQFKGGAYHNTLLVNRRDAFEYLGTWAYGKQEIGDVLQVGESGGFSYICASHANYFPAIHTRMLAFDRRMLVVMDRVDNRKPEDQVNIYYNVNAESVERQPSGIFTARLGDRKMAAACSDNLDCELLEGRMSEWIDHAQKTTILNFNSSDESRLFVTVFEIGEECRNVEIRRMKDTAGSGVACITAGERSYEFVWSYGSQKLKVGNGHEEEIDGTVEQ